MSKQARRALLDRLNGVQSRRNPIKHPILSGAVKLTTYVPPSWRYGNHRG
jgi:hypothetical protein